MHAHCYTCDAIRPVKVKPLTHPDITGRFLGGDMTCAICGSIICTLYKPIEEPAAISQRS